MCPFVLFCLLLFFLFLLVFFVYSLVYALFQWVCKLYVAKPLWDRDSDFDTKRLGHIEAKTKHTATHRDIPQHTATHCNTQQDFDI